MGVGTSPAGLATNIFQNSLVSPADITSTDELLTSLKNQKELSSRIELSQFHALFESSSSAAK